MRIVLTVHQFLPKYSSGTEILTYDTARELRARGHEVFIFTGYPATVPLDDDERFDTYDYDGFHVTRFNHAYVAMGGQSDLAEAEYNNVFVARYFRKYIDDVRPDIVHFFHLGRISASVIAVCHEKNIPMTLTPTDFWFVCQTNLLRLIDNSMCIGPCQDSLNCIRHLTALNMSPEINTAMKRIPDWLLSVMVKSVRKGLFPRHWFAQYVRTSTERIHYLQKSINLLDKVFVPTRLMERILVGNGLDPERVIYSPFGINLNHIVRQTKDAPRDILRIGYIGTLYEHKGVHVLLKALRNLPMYDQLHLKIYGKMEEFPEYVRELKVIAADDTRIQFCGTFPNEKIGEIFAELDVVVVPSTWYENTPLVIYSAQAAGCPVIASNLGGMSEVIHHDENGLLFEPGDVSGLAELLESIVLDRELVGRLSRNAMMPKSIPEYVDELLAEFREKLEVKLG
jgi:glycosyltransferase involved in cell wall biosynthesis